MPKICGIDFNENELHSLTKQKKIRGRIFGTNKHRNHILFIVCSMLYVYTNKHTTEMIYKENQLTMTDKKQNDADVVIKEIHLKAVKKKEKTKI